MRFSFGLSAIVLAIPFTIQASVDPDMLALVPAASQSIGGIDFARARSSTFGQYLLTRIDADDKGLRDFVKETGFDPRSDLEELLFAGTSARDENAPDHGVVIARGNFNRERIKASEKAKGAKVRFYSGVETIVKGSGSKQTGIAFPRTDVAILGDLDTVQSMLANRSAPAVLDARLQAQVDSIGDGNDAWFASVSGEPFFWKHMASQTPASAPAGAKHPAPNQTMDPANAKALQSIMETAGGLRFGDVIEVSLNAQTRSPQDATSLADVIRFFSSMLQMERQKDPHAAILASAFDGMTLKTDGSSVHAALSIPEKDMEKLMAGGSSVAIVN